MKRILFNDQVALTAAVLEGRKTQTRRVVLQKLLDRAEEYAGQYTMSWQKDEARVEYLLRNAPYKVGEVVAVSQSYKDIYTEMMLNVGENFLGTIYEKFQIGYVENSPAWGNKMYVCAELMPHKVEITSVGVCRLQYISDKDCMAEGVQAVNTTVGVRYAAGGVKISWNKVAGAKGYYVYRKTGSGSYSRIAATTALSYVDKTAKSGTTYTYAVRAYNGSSLSAYTNNAIACKK